MENASKALLIAGGIFLGIITLSILVVLMNNISNIGASQEEKRKAEELAAWNAEWEAYNKGFLRGAEVLTIVNKAKQNNIEYYVEVEVNSNSGDNITEDLLNMTTQIFSCKEFEYSANTGRVNKIVFELST